MEYRLLEKTEIWIRPVALDGVDLTACARAAAQALGVRFDEIMVTDVFEDRLTLDVLVPTIKAEQIMGCEHRLIQALASVPGVRVSSETTVHSDGILGLVALDEKRGKEILDRSRVLAARIASRIAKRSIVFSTGQEVLGGQIRDTNTPFLSDMLQVEGYDVVRGPALVDNAVAISRTIRHAVEAGYGLVITTGGVGAEGKDQTLEALLHLDPDAQMPYVLKFQVGRGRHQKDGVRIGVATVGQTLIVSLPGPHDEVQLVWPTLKRGLKVRWSKPLIAAALARTLRGKFIGRSRQDTAEIQDRPVEVSHGPEGNIPSRNCTKTPRRGQGSKTHRSADGRLP
jgi:molybdenum cofactor synthesis domain-containing protein